MGAARDVALADLSEGGSCFDTSEKQAAEGEAKDACGDCRGQQPGEMALARDAFWRGETDHRAEEDEDESANGDCPHQPGSKGSAFLPAHARRETPDRGGLEAPPSAVILHGALGSFGGECSDGGCLDRDVLASGLSQRRC